jgi:hypothetical protein
MLTYGFYGFLLLCEGAAVILLTLALIHKLRSLRG